jgi:hypothetical protein
MATQKLSERLKFDVGLIPQTISNSNATGTYFDMRGYVKAAIVCIDGANAINKVTKVEFLQATARAGTGAKVVKQANASAGTESSASNTAAAAKVTKATVVTIDPTSVLNAETLTVTDPKTGTEYVFTGHTNTTTPADREFDISGTDAQDATALYGLLEHATYGVPNLTTVDDGSGLLTLSAPDVGTVTVETDAITKFVLATTQQLLYTEIDIGDMDLDGGLYYLACKVTKAGNGIVGAILLRQKADYPPAQHAAVGTVL